MAAGCVDLFPVFQISGENPATNGLLHLISDGQRAPGVSLIWQVMSYHWNAQGVRGWEELKSLPEPFRP